MRNIRQQHIKCITQGLLGNTEKYKEEMKKTQKTEGKVSSSTICVTFKNSYRDAEQFIYDHVAC